MFMQFAFRLNHDDSNKVIKNADVTYENLQTKGAIINHNRINALEMTAPEASWWLYFILLTKITRGMQCLCSLRLN